MERYVAFAKVGQGSYGDLWRCLDKETGGVVAVKVFREAQKNDEVLRCAMREAHLLNSLNNQNVVRLLEAYRSTTGKIYLVLEYVPHTLSHKIREWHGLPLADIKCIMQQLLLTVKFLHRNKIMHRDIKPANILLDEHGTLKLCDFGLARVVKSHGSIDAKANAMTPYVVTRWYRAPEVLVGDVYGMGVDVWAIGCVFAEMVLGQPLMPGKSYVEQLALVWQTVGLLSQRQLGIMHSSMGAKLPIPDPATIIPLEQRLPRCTPDMMQVLRACLHPDPLLRASIDDLLQMPYFQNVPAPEYLARPGGLLRPAPGEPSTEEAQAERFRQWAAEILSGKPTSGKQGIPSSGDARRSPATAAAAIAAISSQQPAAGIPSALGAAGAAAPAAVAAQQQNDSVAEDTFSSLPAPIPGMHAPMGPRNTGDSRQQVRRSISHGSETVGRGEVRSAGLGVQLQSGPVQQPLPAAEPAAAAAAPRSSLLQLLGVRQSAPRAPVQSMEQASTAATAAAARQMPPATAFASSSGQLRPSLPVMQHPSRQLQHDAAAGRSATAAAAAAAAAAAGSSDGGAALGGLQPGALEWTAAPVVAGDANRAMLSSQAYASRVQQQAAAPAAAALQSAASQQRSAALAAASAGMQQPAASSSTSSSSGSSGRLGKLAQLMQSLHIKSAFRKEGPQQQGPAAARALGSTAAGATAPITSTPAAIQSGPVATSLRGVAGHAATPSALARPPMSDQLQRQPLLAQSQQAALSTLPHPIQSAEVRMQATSSRQPPVQPTLQPPMQAPLQPAVQPAAQLPVQTRAQPTALPPMQPPMRPSSMQLTGEPTMQPTAQPSQRPMQLDMQPTEQTTMQPSLQPPRPSPAASVRQHTQQLPVPTRIAGQTVAAPGMATLPVQPPFTGLPPSAAHPVAQQAELLPSKSTSNPINASLLGAAAAQQAAPAALRHPARVTTEVADWNQHLASIPASTTSTALPSHPAISSMLPPAAAAPAQAAAPTAHQPRPRSILSPASLLAAEQAALRPLAEVGTAARAAARAAAYNLLANSLADSYGRNVGVAAPSTFSFRRSMHGDPAIDPMFQQIAAVVGAPAPAPSAHAAATATAAAQQAAPAAAGSFAAASANHELPGRIPSASHAVAHSTAAAQQSSAASSLSAQQHPAPSQASANDATISQILLTLPPVRTGRLSGSLAQASGAPAAPAPASTELTRFQAAASAVAQVDAERAARATMATAAVAAGAARAQLLPVVQAHAAGSSSSTAAAAAAAAAGPAAAAATEAASAAEASSMAASTSRAQQQQPDAAAMPSEHWDDSIMARSIAFRGWSVDGRSSGNSTFGSMRSEISSEGGSALEQAMLTGSPGASGLMLRRRMLSISYHGSSSSHNSSRSERNSMDSAASHPPLSDPGPHHGNETPTSARPGDVMWSPFGLPPPSFPAPKLPAASPAAPGSMSAAGAASAAAGRYGAGTSRQCSPPRRSSSTPQLQGPPAHASAEGFFDNSAPRPVSDVVRGSEEPLPSGPLTGAERYGLQRWGHPRRVRSANQQGSRAADAESENDNDAAGAGQVSCGPITQGVLPAPDATERPFAGNGGVPGHGKLSAHAAAAPEPLPGPAAALGPYRGPNRTHRTLTGARELLSPGPLTAGPLVATSRSAAVHAVARRASLPGRSASEALGGPSHRRGEGYLSEPRQRPLSPSAAGLHGRPHMHPRGDASPPAVAEFQSRTSRQFRTDGRHRRTRLVSSPSHGRPSSLSPLGRAQSSGTPLHRHISSPRPSPLGSMLADNLRGATSLDVGGHLSLQQPDHIPQAFFEPMGPRAQDDAGNRFLMVTDCSGSSGSHSSSRGHAQSNNGDASADISRGSSWGTAAGYESAGEGVTISSEAPAGPNSMPTLALLATLATPTTESAENLATQAAADGVGFGSETLIPYDSEQVHLQYGSLSPNP